MRVLQEIYRWSSEIPAWQSDALRRLLRKGELSLEDQNDLYSLLKAEHGIPDSNGRTAQPLSAEEIPGQVEEHGRITLVAIKNLRHVNALAEDQRLEVSPEGVTVVYGDNGTGKSGYSRVLKRACRARDGGEEILNNIYDSANAGAVAEGDFEIDDGNGVRAVHWMNGSGAPAELSTIAVFDSRCARAYLDSEGDFSYVPYGLDVLEGLAKLCNTLKGRLQDELAQFVSPVSSLPSFKSHTAVGRLVASLSEKTQPSEVERLCSMSKEESARCEALAAALQQSDPTEKARHLRLCVGRVQAIADDAAKKRALVNEQVASELRELADQCRQADQDAELARTQFVGGEQLLPGTGGAAWHQLFEAARRFALECHPHRKFPALGSDAECPLCQQPLGESASRFVRFDAFIMHGAERTARECRKMLDERLRQLDGEDLDLHVNDAMCRELDSLSEGLASMIREFETALKDRREALRCSVETGQWDSGGEISIDPRVRLTDLASRASNEADACEIAADAEARGRLQAEYAELDGRKNLAVVKGSVLDAIACLKHRANLERCLGGVKTTAISAKAKQLVNETICQKVEGVLNREFELMGVGSLKVSRKTRIERGRILYKLVLNSAKDHGLVKVLSEGEQRAVAIASFLADVELEGGRGGVVFDDPVSSLDHARRELVARRLAVEGKVRQVIVFTHDLYFLRCLEDECTRTEIQCVVRSLTQRNWRYGVPESELPFEGKNTEARIGALRNLCQGIAKLFRQGNAVEHKKLTQDAYAQLRMAWERAIEEVLFQQVVVRFRKSVETNRLVTVEVKDSDYELIAAAMSKCSNYAAHDRAELCGVMTPQPDELKNDIETLDQWRKEVHGRSKSLKERRKPRTASASVAVNHVGVDDREYAVNK